MPASPDDAAVQAFFDERKANFRAPEYRTVNFLVLTANALARPESMSDADLRKRYDEIKAQRFGTPEKRRIERILFPSLDEARLRRRKSPVVPRSSPLPMRRV